MSPGGPPKKRVNARSRTPRDCPLAQSLDDGRGRAAPEIERAGEMRWYRGRRALPSSWTGGCFVSPGVFAPEARWRHGRYPIAQDLRLPLGGGAPLRVVGAERLLQAALRGRSRALLDLDSPAQYHPLASPPPRHD